VKLNAAGVDDKQLRRLVLAALRKAGYGPKRKPINPDKSSGEKIGNDVPAAGPSRAPLSALDSVVRFDFLTFSFAIEAFVDDPDQEEAEAWR
jgi:hypothetical protein